MPRRPPLPDLSVPEQLQYIETHLSNELEWLLRAASHWHVHTQLDLQVPGFEMVVVAMDSAVLHARALFEFFTKDDTGSNWYALDQYDLERPHDRGVPTISPLYDDWVGPIHDYLMHLKTRRSGHQFLCSDMTTRLPLNQMPVEFAREALVLWRDFVDRLNAHPDSPRRPMGAAAQRVLDDAMAHTANVFSVELPGLCSVVPPIAW